MNKNTCDEINSWFENYLDWNGYQSLNISPFFAFGLKHRTHSDGILFHSEDEGFFKCDNPPFSDFAV
jgi:hypothetical protein